MIAEEARASRKRRTRTRIADAAMRLFREHGFDKVTVAQVAATADVSEKTVYNYFPTKAGLFFDEGDDLLAELLHAVGTRATGESALTAVRGFVAGMPEWAADRRPARPGKLFRDLIADSPALQAHRRWMFARYETELAALPVEQTRSPPGAVEPFVVAVALVGVLRAAFEVRGGDADRSLDLLAHGLGDYPSAPSG